MHLFDNDFRALQATHLLPISVSGLYYPFRHSFREYKWTHRRVKCIDSSTGITHWHSAGLVIERSRVRVQAGAAVFVLHGQLSVLSLISVSVLLPCYRTNTCYVVILLIVRAVWYNRAGWLGVKHQLTYWYHLCEQTLNKKEIVEPQQHVKDPGHSDHTQKMHTGGRL